MSIERQILDRVSNLGFSEVRVAPLSNPISFEFYENWIQNEYHGDMNYLKEHLQTKKSPKNWSNFANSIITVSHSYYPHPKSPGKSKLKVAKYAQGEDYHLWLKEKLEKAIELLKELNPSEQFVSAVDTAPLLERDLAYQSGLGWIGKNTCLIQEKHGSYFFIAEILSSIKFSEIQVAPDRCGKCTRCIEACPTGALEEPKLLNSNKCISYLTIESKTVPDESLREKIGDWFFGCDICQEVCPWNEKLFGPAQKNQDNEASQIEELAFVLTASNRKLEKYFSGTPLLRARPFGLRRNAMIVATNRKFTSLRSQIEAWIDDEKLGDLARWAIAKMPH